MSLLRKKKAPPLPPTAQRNLDAIMRVEQQFLLRRPWLERVGDAVAFFFGSVYFLLVHAAVIGAWLVWNLPPHLRSPLSHRKAFDPYPFPLLSLAVGIEFILLTTFVLMNQKHQSRRNEHWAHLHLQLSLLTEQEVTKNLQLLDAIARQMGISIHTTDSQFAELSRPTSVHAMVGALAAARDPAPQAAHEAIAAAASPT